MDKFFEATSFVQAPHLEPTDPESPLHWAGLYYQVNVLGSPAKTEQAKRKDLSCFLGFYIEELGHTRVDSWTPAVTKHFQLSLATAISPIAKQLSTGIENWALAHS